MKPMHVSFAMAAFALGLWGADAWFGISARVAAREAAAPPAAAPVTAPAPRSGCEIEDWTWTVDDGWLEIEGTLKNYAGNWLITLSLYEGKGADGQRGRYLGNEQAAIHAGGAFQIMRRSGYTGDRLSITYACE